MAWKGYSPSREKNCRREALQELFGEKLISNSSSRGSAITSTSKGVGFKKVERKASHKAVPDL